MDKNFIRPLRENEIECRVSAINAKGVMLILYKDVRVDQRILDETFGAFGWKRSHQCIDGNLYCTVEIRDSKTGEWIAKQDVGTTGYAEKEKSKASDSLNRQAVMFEEACVNGYASSAFKFAVFAEQWLEDYAKPKYKKTTMYKIEHVVKRINEEIGHKRLDKITPRDIQALIKSLTNGNEAKGYKPLAPKTVKNYISYVSTVFEYAIRLDMMSRNPCSRANIPVGKTKERDIYTLEEAQLFIDTLVEKAPIVYQTYFILAIYSGFRRGELSGLTWDNIDFENHIITIDKALYYTNAEGTIIDTPKTETSQRSLKLPDVIFDFMKRLQDFYADEAVRLGTKWEENNFVFRNEFGGVLSPLSPNSCLHKFCARENLRYVNIHSFRHLNASLLIDSGASVKTVQACMGHSMASTTLNIYAHSFRRSQAIASEAVADNFKLL